MNLEPVSLKSDRDYPAPDKSDIRLLCVGETAGLCHCTLTAGKVSAAVKHRKVEELWYVLEGRGQIWREGHGVIDVAPGMSFVIPPKTGFQFRSDQSSSLVALIATIPPWPGEDEAEPANAFWS